MARPTVAQRILVHLSLFASQREAYECPPAVTQKGIAAALGLSRSHVALEVRKLVDEGHGETRLAHVQGARSRRKVYFLTASGEGMAASLRRRAQEAEARWMEGEGPERTGTGAEALQAARRLERPLAPVYEGLLAGDVVDLRGVPSPEERAEPPPLVGRREELARLKTWREAGPTFLVVTGLAGIGKTALARAFVREAEGLWVKVFPFHSPSSLLAATAHALSGRGRGRLLACLRGSPPDLAEAGLLLSREAAGLLLAFDDVTASDASGVLRLLLDRPPQGARILLTGRRLPTFLRPEDLAAGRVEELRLQGLPLEDAGRLLEDLKPSREEVRALHGVTGGHPLLLKLLARAPGARKRAEIEMALLEEVLAGLEPAEVEALTRASVYRRPVPRAALGEPSLAVVGRLLRGGLLTEAGDGLQVHDVLAPLLARHLGEGARPAHRHAAAYWASREAWLESLHHRVAAGEGEALVPLAEERVGAILERGQAGELLDLLDALPGGASRVAYLRARALDYLGRSAEALARLEEGLAAAGGRERVPLLLLRGRLHSKRGALPEAQEAFRAAAELADDPRREGEAAYGLGIVERKRGRLREARRHLQAARRAFQASEARTQEGRALMEMGIVQLQTNAPEEAVAWFRRARPLLAGRRVDEAYRKTNLGIALSRLGRTREALDAFEASRRLAEEAGMVRAEGSALANAADLYVEVGEVERALEAAGRGLEIFRQLEDPVMTSACLANQAKAVRASGDLEGAERLYGESVRSLEGTQAPHSLAARWLEMSELYREMGRGGRAEELRREAETLLRGPAPGG